MTTPIDNNIVRLVVNGSEYAGWKSVRIEAGIERQARSFDLSVTDRWPGSVDVAKRIKPFDLCQVFIGQDLVLTGFVDATPVKYDGKTLSVGVKGRSKTADLVDCCPVQGLTGPVATKQWADVKTSKSNNSSTGKVVTPAGGASGQWRNLKLETIAAALAAPYSVRVLSEMDTGRPIADHTVQVGESVFESIDRMMRIRHVLSTDNADGDLVFIDVGSTGTATTAIELGVNVRSGDAGLDFKGVFSEYVVKGQRAGNDSAYAGDVSEEEGLSQVGAGEQMTGDTASTRDSRSKRRRVLVIKQSGQADEGTCQDRAEYERANRAAKALQTTYVVSGWRQDSGELWQANQMVQVRDPLIGFNGTMVIAGIAWVLDEQGQRAELRVGPPDGYRSKAGQLKKSQKGGGPEWTDVKDKRK